MPAFINKLWFKIIYITVAVVWGVYMFILNPQLYSIQRMFFIAQDRLYAVMPYAPSIYIVIGLLLIFVITINFKKRKLIRDLLIIAVIAVPYGMSSSSDSFIMPSVSVGVGILAVFVMIFYIIWYRATKQKEITKTYKFFPLILAIIALVSITIQTIDSNKKAYDACGDYRCRNTVTDSKFANFLGGVPNEDEELSVELTRLNKCREILNSVQSINASCNIIQLDNKKPFVVFHSLSSNSSAKEYYSKAAIQLDNHIICAYGAGKGNSLAECYNNYVASKIGVEYDEIMENSKNDKSLCDYLLNESIAKQINVVGYVDSISILEGLSGDKMIPKRQTPIINGNYTNFYLDKENCLNQ